MGLVQTDLHYGVCVGINYYPDIGNLQHARSDAVAFAAWLDSVGVTGDRLEMVMLATHARKPAARRGATPRVDQIWEAVRAKSDLARAAIAVDPKRWAETRLYFFFSGHGIAPTGRDASGLAADCSADDFGNSASIAAMIDFFVDAGDFAEIVAVADCCRQIPNQSGISPGRPPWNPRPSPRPEGVQVAELYATTYGTLAREPNNGQQRDKDVPRELDAERGYFTRALLEGLKGEPLAMDNSRITTKSLNRYARQRVMALTENKQKPPLSVGDEIVLVDAAVLRAVVVVRQVRIVLPVAVHGRVSLVDGSLRERASHDADGNDWVVQLEPGLYKVQAHGAELANDGQFMLDDAKEEFRVSL
jgi:hypothetical protein